mmetsp:Transcript_15321/g.36557  ORF Transcript_15321/g.36557 Transcript_15321/m.36557 type:complete len:258 (-) Transcript_15321:968-1741(-)
MLVQGLLERGVGNQGQEGAGHAVARAVGHDGKPAFRVVVELVEVAADDVARLPDQAGIGQPALQRRGRHAQHRALDDAGVIDALHDVAVALRLLFGNHAHQVQAIAQAREPPLLDHQEAVRQRLLAGFDGQQGQGLDGGAGIDDQRLLVHEGDAALLVEQLLVKGLGDLRQEKRSVDQADRPALLQNRQAAELPVAREDLVDLGVGVFRRHRHAGHCQIGGNRLCNAGLGPQRGGSQLVGKGHGPAPAVSGVKGCAD